MRQRWLEERDSLTDETQGLPVIARTREAEGLFVNWRRSSSPLSLSDWYLGCSFNLAGGDYGHPLVAVFRRYAMQQTDRSFTETTRWDHAGWIEPGYHGWGGELKPLERCKLCAVAALAHAFETEGELDTTKLVPAAREVVEYSAGQRTAQGWEAVRQSAFLVAVMWLLYAGELADAKAAMRLRKRFHSTRVMHEWVRRAVALWPAARDEPPSEAFSEHVRTLFEQVRDPNYKRRQPQPSVQEDHDRGELFIYGTPLLRMVVALIEWRWVQRRPLAGRWRELFDNIAY